MAYTLAMNPLRRHRKAKGLTLDDVAPDIGVSPSQLSRIEREGTASLEVAIKLARVTGDPVEAFRKPEAAAA